MTGVLQVQTVLEGTAQSLPRVSQKNANHLALERDVGCGSQADGCKSPVRQDLCSVHKLSESLFRDTWLHPLDVFIKSGSARWVSSAGWLALLSHRIVTGAESLIQSTSEQGFLECKNEKEEWRKNIFCWQLTSNASTSGEGSLDLFGKNEELVCRTCLHCLV